MTYVRTILLVLGLSIAAFVAFLIGRHTATQPVTDPGCIDVARDVERFSKLHEDILSYVAAHDGHVPLRPYRDMVEAGVVSSFTDFIFGGRVVLFNVWALPPKINTEFSLNARAPFFWVVRPSIHEVWVVYLDGTWERESRRGVINVGELSNFGKAVVSWDRAFHDAGYPYWTSLEEKAEWWDKEAQHMRWDGERGMFVPRPRTPKASP